MVIIGIALMLVIVFFWGSPGKLILGLGIVSLCGVLLVYLIRARRESSIRLVDSYMPQRDVEIGEAVNE